MVVRSRSPDGVMGEERKYWLAFLVGYFYECRTNIICGLQCNQYSRLGSTFPIRHDLMDSVRHQNNKHYQVMNSESPTIDAMTRRQSTDFVLVYTFLSGNSLLSGLCFPLSAIRTCASITWVPLVLRADSGLLSVSELYQSVNVLELARS